MANFINTVDALGDDIVADSIINRSIVECKDNIVSFIGDDAFYGCYELTTIDFPAVTNIGNSAFKYCASLVTTILRNDSMVSLADPYVFSSCYHITGTVNSTYNPTGIKDGYIYVPSTLCDSYATDSSWSTYAGQFRKLEEWTVDGTTTGELDLVNRHMVRFFNSDGTLLGYQIVATGEDAVYDDTPVCPEDASAPFSGFEPSPINVTADIDCYAQYISFATCSWEKIAEISEAGDAENYFAIGDEKTFVYNNDQTLTAVIIGFNHDDLADGSGKAGITCLVKPFIPEQRVAWSGVTETSYTNSYVHQRMNNTIIGYFPSEMQSVIKPVNKEFMIKYEYGSATLSTVSEKLWAMSRNEWFNNQTTPALGTYYKGITVKPGDCYLGSSIGTFHLRDVSTMSSLLPYYINVKNDKTYTILKADSQSITTTRHVVCGFCV